MALSRPIRGYSRYLVNPHGQVFHAGTLNKKASQFYTVRFRDGNKNNFHINNLSFKKVSVILTFDSKDHVLGKRIWRVKGKAKSASERTDCGGNLTSDEVYRCLLVAQFKCYYCGEDLIPTNWQLDHALPVCQGGKNEFKNLRASCRNCNMMKGSMTIAQFRERINILYERFKGLG